MKTKQLISKFFIIISFIFLTTSYSMRKIKIHRSCKVENNLTSLMLISKLTKAIKNNNFPKIIEIVNNNPEILKYKIDEAHKFNPLNFAIINENINPEIVYFFIQQNIILSNYKSPFIYLCMRENPNYTITEILFQELDIQFELNNIKMILNNKPEVIIKICNIMLNQAIYLDIHVKKIKVIFDFMSNQIKQIPKEIILSFKEVLQEDLSKHKLLLRDIFGEALNETKILSENMLKISQIVNIYCDKLIALLDKLSQLPRVSLLSRFLRRK